MRKHWKIFLACLLIGLTGALLARGMSGDAPAHEPREPAEPRSDAGLLVDLGNDTCPVMGNPVDGRTWFEWNHLRIGFCCPGCDKRFAADPEGALDGLDGDWREAAAAIEAYRTAGPSHKSHLLEQIRERWRIVRGPEEG